MNTSDLQRKLIAAARVQSPSEAVPYSFEKRIMARLVGVRPVDAWAVWASALWRAAVPCIVITLLFTAWTFFATPPGASSTDLSAELDNTLLAGAVQDQSSQAN